MLAGARRRAGVHHRRVEKQRGRSRCRGRSARRCCGGCRARCCAQPRAAACASAPRTRARPPSMPSSTSRLRRNMRTSADQVVALPVAAMYDSPAPTEPPKASVGDRSAGRARAASRAARSVSLGGRRCASLAVEQRDRAVLQLLELRCSTARSRRAPEQAGARRAASAARDHGPVRIGVCSCGRPRSGRRCMRRVVMHGHALAATAAAPASGCRR